ncbi:MAG: DUF4136 domain-containing protein [Gammaproteobacteria bacterium]|nr:DUF4136 domain-containing protein [Gammaproteobacteria bacterium]
MLNRTALLLALALFVAVAGCATAPAPRHESQAAPGVHLAGYGTFSLASPAGDAGGDPPLRILDANIRDAIRAEMTRRGYREDDGNPDLRIDYETAAQDKVRSSPVRFGVGMGSWGGNVGGSVSMGTPSIESYQEGQLVIHVADAAKNQEVWYGTVSGQVDRQKLDAVAVARAVALAMESFPARAAVLPGAQ